MKQFLRIICISALITLMGGVAKRSNAQLIEQGDVIIDTYYGWSLYTSFIRAVANESGANVKVYGTGPVGGRFEYMMTDKIGLGADIYYVRTGVRWEDSDTSNSIVYDYDAYRSKIGANVRFNFHFAGSENFDSYFFVGAGYSGKTWGYKTNDPNYVESTTGGLVPVDFRIGVGARYFFVPNFGLNMELAAGGALISGGVSARF